MQEVLETCNNEESESNSLSLQNDQQLDYATENVSTIITEDLSFISNILIPTEIILHILQYLDCLSLICASKVNKSWQTFAKQTTISWKAIFERYTQGFLWPYLFSKPDIDSYQSYFSEIWDDNFPKGLQRIKEAYIVDIAKYGRENVKNYGEKYLQKFDADQIKSESLATITSLLQLTPDLRQGLLKQYDNEKCFNFSLKDCQLILPILIQIHKTDSLLTASIVIGKVIQPYRPNLWHDQWPYQKQAILLDEDDITALILINQYIFKTILTEPKLAFLLNKLTETSLFKILSILYPWPNTINSFIKHPEIFFRFSENKLIEVLVTLHCNLIEDFYYLVDKNPSFAPHIHAEFLIKLAEAENSFIPLILAHPKLLELLTEDQFIKILSKIIYLSDLNKILNSETFWSFLLSFKVKNKSDFLLRFPHLEEVIKNDKAAALLEPEATLKKVINSNVKAEALAAQYIILDKFNDDQFLRLAMTHYSLSLLMLPDEKLLPRWTKRNLKKIRKHWESFSNSHRNEVEQINTCCNKVLTQVRNRNKPNLILKTIANIQPPQPNTTSSNATVIIDPQNDLALSKNETEIKEKITLSSPNQLVFSKWQIAGMIALSLLGIAGVALLATGVGSLLGVAFLTSLLTAINVFNISISTAAILSTIAGTMTLIFSGIMSIKNKLRNCFSCTSEGASFDTDTLPSFSSSYRSLTEKQLKKDSELNISRDEILTQSIFQHPSSHRSNSPCYSTESWQEPFSEDTQENTIINTL